MELYYERLHQLMQLGYDDKQIDAFIGTSDVAYTDSLLKLKNPTAYSKIMHTKWDKQLQSLGFTNDAIIGTIGKTPQSCNWLLPKHHYTIKVAVYKKLIKNLMLAGYDDTIEEDITFTANDNAQVTYKLPTMTVADSFRNFLFENHLTTKDITNVVCNGKSMTCKEFIQKMRNVLNKDVPMINCTVADGKTIITKRTALCNWELV